MASASSSSIFARACLLLIVAGLAGCTTETATAIPELDQARAAYGAASADPDVALRAPEELSQARDALQRAEGLNRDGEDPAGVRHFAYLAERYAETAQQSARLKAAQDRIRATNEAPAMGASAAPAPQGQAQEQPQGQSATQAEQQIASLQPTSGSTVLVLGDTLFAAGTSQLLPTAQETLRQLAVYLGNNPTRTVLIQGFSDDSGDQDGDVRFAQERADAVRRALIDDGVSASRMLARSFGPARPVAPNDSPEGRQLNRRVQIVISDPSGLFPAGST